jgi:hypothetical protein
MKIKYGFKELKVKIEDCTFSVKELDRNELTLKNTSYDRVGDKTVKRVDFVSVINEFFRVSVIGWDNLINAETGVLIPFSDEAKENIPFDVKLSVYNASYEQSRLTETEKKS